MSISPNISRAYARERERTSGIRGRDTCASGGLYVGRGKVYLHTRQRTFDGFSSAHVCDAAGVQAMNQLKVRVFWGEPGDS